MNLATKRELEASIGTDAIGKCNVLERKYVSQQELQSHTATHTQTLETHIDTHPKKVRRDEK